jgi:hypothetical protein
MVLTFGLKIGFSSRRNGKRNIDLFLVLAICFCLEKKKIVLHRGVCAKEGMYLPKRCFTVGLGIIS